MSLSEFLREVAVTNKKQGGIRYPGFSERFNDLLDQVDFPRLGNGRRKELSSAVGVALRTPAAWLLDDQIPSALIFRRISKAFALALKTNVSPEHIEVWLMYGHEPFIHSIEPLSLLEGFRSELEVYCQLTGKNLPANKLEILSIQAAGLCYPSLEFDQNEPAREAS